MKLFNSLTRQLEDFEPINPPNVGVYTCGPTVYSYVTIGNWRTYFLGDLIVRTLKFKGYKPTYVMNITDVGHLTGDNLGDADIGEDKLEKAAKQEQKTAWDVANFYANDFLEGYRKLNLTQPFRFSRATQHIKEQLAMIKQIEEKGFTYRTSDGIYFDTQKYEAEGNEYGKLSNIDQVKEGARVEPNPEKKDPRDFALWKFSYPNGRNFDPEKDNPFQKRAMEWESPWGLGFPGWHIECSAMSTKYLGDQFDIHIGGEDLRSTHHPNEIAQTEAATGKKPFVKYWVHGAFLLVDCGRMGKSLGNAYTLHDLEKKGFKPEHLRYFYLTGHYRQSLNFTWENLEAAKKTYEHLLERLAEFKKEIIENEKGKLSEKAIKFDAEFIKALENDLQTPQTLAVLWEMVKSDLSSKEKYQLLMNWDGILGLNLKEASKKHGFYYTYTGKKSGTRITSVAELPSEILRNIDNREIARRDQDWETADKIREAIKSQGYVVEDVQEGVVVRQ
ncbi:MAG: cysteine--tRNA ligase [Patescibacteria group bacterium]|jgi:cysteinyl-tRNA synthetase